MTISSNTACSALLRRASPASSHLRSAIFCRSNRSRPIDTWSTSAQIPLRLTWIFGIGQARRRWLDRSAVTPEEFVAEMQAQDAGKLEPGTFVDVRAEEFLKACRGETSELGEAIRSFHKKYGAGAAL